MKTTNYAWLWVLVTIAAFVIAFFGYWKWGWC
jgi:hypothetical protein